MIPVFYISLLLDPTTVAAWASVASAFVAFVALIVALVPILIERRRHNRDLELIVGPPPYWSYQEEYDLIHMNLRIVACNPSNIPKAVHEIEVAPLLGYTIRLSYPAPPGEDPMRYGLSMAELRNIQRNAIPIVIEVEPYRSNSDRFYVALFAHSAYQSPAPTIELRITAKDVKGQQIGNSVLTRISPPPPEYF